MLPLPVIDRFSQVRMNNIPFIGDEKTLAPKMNANLTVQSINMPQAFLVTNEAFKIFVQENNLQLPLTKILRELDTQKFSNIAKVGKAARQLVLENEVPHKLEIEIRNAHYQLCGEETNVSVTVHGTATTQNDPPVFTQQLQSFSNIRGEDALINVMHKCFASLFSEKVMRMFDYNTINLADIAITISVQKMPHADLSSSNHAFTVDRLKSFNKIMSFKNIEQGCVL